MAKQIINVGTTANDKKGDSLRAAFQKVNANFTDLYTALGLNADNTLDIGAFEFVGSVMTTTDSSTIVIDQAASITSNLSVGGDLIFSDNTVQTTAWRVDYLGVPASTVTTTSTLTIADAGEHVYVNSASQTITIPANSSVAYPIGTTITFIAGPSATTVTIAIATDTMYLAGTGTTGSRTLAAYGMSTAIKVAATVWFINGTGLT